METYGWFEYEHPSRTIWRRTTGQRLVICTERVESAWKTFDLLNAEAEIEQPLRVTHSKREGYIARLTLDYYETAFVPSGYGHWRRIDDFVVDALMCWAKVFGCKTAFGVLVTGCWKGGRWNPRARRDFRGEKMVFKAEDLVSHPIAEPIMVPLDLPAPKTWQFMDVESSATEASLSFERLPETNIPYLPIDREVTGFQGKVPYLRREDGQAFIFFAKLDPSTHRGEDPTTNLYYTYVDENIFFTFRSHSFYHNELGGCTDYGYRYIPPPRSYWPRQLMHPDPLPWDTPRPDDAVLGSRAWLSYSTWLQMMHVISDAWSAWGTPRKLVQVSSEMVLPDYYGRHGYIGDYGPTFSWGFIGGYSAPGLTVYFPDEHGQ